MNQHPVWDLYPVSSLACAPCLKHQYAELYAEINSSDQVSAFCRNHSDTLMSIPSIVNGKQIVAFSGAYGWGEVDDDESFSDDDTDSYEVMFADGIKVIDEHAFSKCKKLRTVRLPSSSLRFLGDGAFLDCFNLQKIVLNGHLVGLGVSAFEGCISLPRIKIPGTVKKIPMSCFLNCNNLIHVTIEEGVEDIDLLAFCNCAESCCIELPTSVRYIHDKAFALTSVVLKVHEGSYAHQWAISHQSKFEFCQ